MASIAKRPNGKWRARYRDSARREHSRHFDRKVDAQRWLDNVTTLIGTGEYVDPRAGRITFKAFYEQWSARQLWEATTVVGHNLAVNSTPFLNNPINTIRTSHVEAWVKTMDATLAPLTVATRYNKVRTVFRAAKRDRVIGVDPCEGVALPRRRRPEMAMTIPAPGVVGRAIAAAEDRYRVLFALCAFAGLRMGEAVAVQVGDIDFLRRQLSVSRQIQPCKGGIEIRPPKYGSERVVYLADDLVSMLAWHVEVNGVMADGGWLFRGKRSRPPHQNTAGNWWRTTCTAAEIEGVRLHDLRHFYASGLIAAGCDVVTVQRALGHHSASTTLRVYSHLWPTAEDRTRKGAQTIMAETMPAPADSVRTGGGKTPGQ